MSSTNIGLLIFLCVFAGALVGMLLRRLLPDHHLSAESKDTVKLATGLIGTMAALVLGLMVASAKSSYDTKRDEVIRMSANALFLDRVLAHYGPEAKEARTLLRHSTASAMERLWPAAAGAPTLPVVTSGPTSSLGEELFEKVHALRPANESQKLLASQAQSILSEMGKTRMLLYQQKASSISIPFLVVVVFWITIMFVSFGLFAPPNWTVLFTLLVCAFSVSGALFLVLELDRPFEGLIQIPSLPIQEALNLLGR